MNRVLEVKNMNRRIFGWNASHNLDIFEIVEFSKKLDEITGNADVNTQYTNIKEIWGWFETVRETLRVGRHLSQNGCETAPTNAQKMKEDYGGRPLLILIRKARPTVASSSGQQDR